jgi:hypothetical protein
MEYNLQKTIEPSFMSPMMGQTAQRLTSSPATDFVNPGIGGEINMFSFYVPLHSTKPIHTIEKKMEKEQEGLGQTDEDLNE